MTKSAMARARVQPDLKHRTETVFHRLALNPTQAITIFYKHVEIRGGLPFDAVIPTASTKKTFEASDAGRDRIITTAIDSEPP